MTKAQLKHEQVFFVPLTLPGLNEILEARQVRGSTRGRKGKIWSKYSALKKEYESLIISAIQLAKIRPVERAYFIFTWVEPNRKRDKDNISAAKKFILDSLVTAGVLPNDGWANVVGWHESFEVKKGRQKAGVRVQIFPDGGG